MSGKRYRLYDHGVVWDSVGREYLGENATIARLNAIQSKADENQKYKDALDEYLVVNWLYTDELMADPRKALHAIARAAEREVLDPSISEPAQKLRDTYKAKADMLEEAALIVQRLRCGSADMSATEIHREADAFLARIQEKQDAH